MLRAPRSEVLFGLALAGAFGGAACHDWDAYDPRLGSGSSSGGGGGGASTTASMGGSGGAGASSSGGGGAGTGGGGGESTEPGSVQCAAHFPALGSYLRHVVVDEQGAIVVVGPIQGGADFGGGMLTVPPGHDSPAIARLDASCEHQWSKAFAGTGKSYFWSAATWPSGDIVAVGGVTADVDLGGDTLTAIGNEDTLVARFDADGTHVWSRSFGLAGVGQWPQSTAIDADGDVLVFGVSYGGFDFGFTPFLGDGLFVAKLSGATGEPIWSQGFAGEGGRASSIAVDAAGNVFLTGRFTQSMDFGGIALSATGMASDGFLVKLDDAGGVTWARRFGSTSATTDDYGHAVATIGAGELALSGRFDGSIAFDSGAVTSAGARDIFLARLDDEGTSSWTTRFGGAGFDSALGMAVDSSSSIALAGRFEGTTDLGGVALTATGEADAFVARYDEGGNHLWSRGFGGAGFQSASSVATDARGRVVVTGYFDGTLDIGDRSFVAQAFDGFLLVLRP